MTPKHKQRLLIVDDEPGPMHSLQVIFEEDYEILSAPNGVRALEYATRYEIDAAILDVRMEGMNGIELLERLKKNDPYTEILILTAFEELDTARQALRLGACDYLAKPFQITEIREAVSRAMHRRAVSQKIHENMHALDQLKNELHQQQMQQDFLKTKGEIYSCILHDINGPLTAMAGLVDILSREITESPYLENVRLASIQRHIASLTSQIAQCTSVSRRYLRFLRDHPAESPQTQLAPLFRELDHLLRTQVFSRGHQLIVHPLSLDGIVHINGIELVQVLLNLAANAFQSSPNPHFVDVSAQILHEPLSIKEGPSKPGQLFLAGSLFQNQAPMVALTVLDSGPGISSDVLPRIFETHFSTKPVNEGTGLGLAIVQRLVHAARGAILVKTCLGEGSSFTVYLPASI